MSEDFVKAAREVKAYSTGSACYGGAQITVTSQFGKMVEIAFIQSFTKKGGPPWELAIIEALHFMETHFPNYSFMSTTRAQKALNKICDEKRIDVQKLLFEYHQTNTDTKRALS